MITVFFLYICDYLTLESFPIPRNRVSYVIPERYSEVTIRIYTRNAEKVAGIQRACREWWKHTVLPQLPNKELALQDMMFVGGNTIPFNDTEWSVIAQRWSPIKTPIGQIRNRPATTHNTPMRQELKGDGRSASIAMSFDNIE